MLAQGTDARLRGLAEKVAARPTDATEQKNLGDEWWDVAEEEHGRGQLNIQLQAYKWYEMAVPGLDGLGRTTAEKRINKVDFHLRASTKAAAWDHLDIRQAKVKDDFLRLQKRLMITTGQAYAGPIEIHLVARTEKNNIRLHAFQTARLIFNWEAKPDELRIHWNDGKGGTNSGSHSSAFEWGPLKPNTWYDLTWRITDKGMKVFVNGKEIFSELKKQNLNIRGPVTVHAMDSVIDVKSLTVRPWK